MSQQGMMAGIPELHVGRGTANLGPLTIFPVWTDAPAPSGLATGKKAQVDVTEREDHPAVEQVVLINRGYTMALLLDGELLEGGWQHRVLQNDVVLAPGVPMTAAVACVEQRRWEGTPTFGRQARRASAGVRAALGTAPPEARQQQVWDRVAEYEAALGPSPTASYADHLDRLAATVPEAPFPYDAHVGELIQGIRRLRPLPGQRGVIAGAGGHPVLAEVFASRAALAAHMHQMLTGLLLDAITAGLPLEPTPGRRARRFAHGLDGIHPAQRPGVNAGAGEALAGETPDVVVRGVGLAGRWAHLTAFGRHHPVAGIA